MLFLPIERYQLKKKYKHPDPHHLSLHHLLIMSLHLHHRTIANFLHKLLHPGGPKPPNCKNTRQQKYPPKIPTKPIQPSFSPPHFSIYIIQPEIPNAWTTIF